MIEETMFLTLYNDSYAAALKEYYQEFEANNEDVNQGRTISGTSYTLLYVRDSDRRLIGLVNLRSGAQELGNIGYSIRPSERRRGYGSALVEEALELAKMFEIKPLQAVCEEQNLASIKVLENNAFYLKKKRHGELVYERKNEYD